MNHQRTLAGRTAFTLIELLVVIGIIGVLVSLALPVLTRVQAKGYETKTLSNMRQMGIALMSYANDNNYQLPGRAASADGTTDKKWPVLLQPYIQDLTIYGSPVPDVKGVSYKVTNPQDYVRNDTNFTTYIYNGGNDSDPNLAAGTPAAAISYPRLNVISQPSQTILLGIPQPMRNNFYMDFTEKNNSTILNKTAFADGTPYVFADGSARTLAVMTAAQAAQPNASNKAEPISSGTYTDWLWLFDKSRTEIIQ